MNHRILEWSQEVLLEFEVGQLFLLQEAHRQLPQRIKCEEADMGILVTADLVEVLAEDLPHAGPLQTDTVHVVVRDLDQLLQAEQPGVLRNAG